MNDIPDGCTGSRGDDRNFSGQKRDRFFMLCIEQALFFQLFFQLFERFLQGTGTFGLHVFKNQLVRPLRFVYGQPGQTHDFQPVFQREFQTPLLVFEHHAPDHGPVILERKIGMAGRRGSTIGDFPGNPDKGIPFLQKGFNLPGQQCYRINMRGFMVRHMVRHQVLVLCKIKSLYIE